MAAKYQSKLSNIHVDFNIWFIEFGYCLVSPCSCSLCSANCLTAVVHTRFKHKSGIKSTKQIGKFQLRHNETQILCTNHVFLLIEMIIITAGLIALNCSFHVTNN